MFIGQKERAWREIRIGDRERSKEGGKRAQVGGLK